MTPKRRPASLTARVPAVRLNANVARLPTQMEAGHRERAALYRSRRWRRERDAFLRAHPLCACGHPAVVVDHVAGHQRADWRVTFWDPSGWQPMCLACHALKSAQELAAWRRSGEGYA